MGKQWKQWLILFWRLQNYCTWLLQSWNEKTLAPWKESYDQPQQHIKEQKHHFADKGLSSQSYGFPSSYVWMWELGHKEGWTLKNWCFWTVVLEKTLESPLNCKEIQPVHPKGNQSWIFIGRTGAEAETPILWLPDVKNWRIGKDPDAGKDWGQEEKGATEEEIVGRHHWLSEHEFEQTPGDSEGQRSLACKSPWGCKESDDFVTKQRQQRLHPAWLHPSFPYMIHGEDSSTSLLHRPDLLSQKQKSNLGKTSNLLF